MGFLLFGLILVFLQVVSCGSQRWKCYRCVLALEQRIVLIPTSVRGGPESSIITMDSLSAMKGGVGVWQWIVHSELLWASPLKGHRWSQITCQPRVYATACEICPSVTIMRETKRTKLVKKGNYKIWKEKMKERCVACAFQYNSIMSERVLDLLGRSRWAWGHSRSSALMSGLKDIAGL